MTISHNYTKNFEVIFECQSCLIRMDERQLSEPSEGYGYVCGCGSEQFNIIEENQDGK